MKDNPSFEYVNEKTAAVDVKIGTLDSLETKSKTDIVSAINELFTNVSDGKALVASAITDKGVSTQSDATFAAMAANVRNIPTDTTPTGTKQITITENGTTTENVTAYENIEITTDVSSGGGLPMNYRAGTFTLENAVAGTAAKVVDLDADALSHRTDKNLMLAIHMLGDYSETSSLGYIATNGVKNGTRYGFGFYQSSSGSYSSQLMLSSPDTVQTAGNARAYVGSDGIYLIAKASCKWKPGTYGYVVLW